jgi:hypothetical protein
LYSVAQVSLKSIYRNRLLNSIFLCACIFSAIADSVMPNKVTEISIGSSFVYLYFSILLMRSIFFGKKLAYVNEDGSAVRPKLIKYFFKLIVIVVISMLLFAASFFPLSYMGVPVEQINNPTVRILLMFVFAFFFSVVSGFLGTWLPATVISRGGGFFDALSRARTTFIKVFFWTFFSTIINLVLEFSLMIITAIYHVPLSPVDSSWKLSILSSFLSLLASAGDLLCTTAIVVAWTLQYAKSEQVPIQGP